MRIALTILLCLLTNFLGAQFSAGVDDTINPGVPVTLTATYGQVGIPVTLSDDDLKGPFPIGFTFTFYGKQYNEFYIASNGWISFTYLFSWGGTRNAILIPSSNDFSPKNCIFAPMQDFNPKQAGSPYVFYGTIGEAPGRQLVVMWCQMPMSFCELKVATFQIVLNEEDQTIETHVFDKPECLTADGNKATLGLQNETGTIGGIAVPGYNATSWIANKKAWKYRPVSQDEYQVDSIPFEPPPITPGEKVSYRWYQGAELLSDQQVTVVSPHESTTYHAVCILCDGEEFTDTVRIHVIPYIPNAFTPNGDGLNDVFRITGLPVENITRFNFQVFNRWGQAIFSTSDIMEGWDGRSKGEYCSADVYSWVIFWEDSKKTRVTNKGTITLVR